MIKDFAKGFLATVPDKNGVAGKAQMPEVLCGILTQEL
jgi:hypothetical protein